MPKVFAYGTLVDKFPDKISPASFTGKYKIDRSGWYPALKPSDITNTISGYILDLTDQEFSEIDSYEGYPDLYDRMLISVNTGNGSEEAWVYFQQ